MTFTLRQIAVPVGMSGIVLFAFSLGWWGGDDGGRRATASGADRAWVLPKRNASDVSTYAQILAQKQPFGALPTTPAAPTAPQPAADGNSSAVEWRVGGIVVTESSRHLIVLIRRPGENMPRNEIRHPGEKLPDGSIIRAVEPTNVTIDRQGTIIRIGMFAQH